MNGRCTQPGLTGRRARVAGGSGAVGEGIVRAHLEAGAEVIVPTRSETRAAQLRGLLGPAVSERLHIVVADDTSFAGADALAGRVFAAFGVPDDVVAEVDEQRRVFSVVLGPVMTRQRSPGDLDWLTAAQVGQVTVAASGAPAAGGREIRMRSQADIAQAIQLLGAHEPERADAGSATRVARAQA